MSNTHGIGPDVGGGYSEAYVERLVRANDGLINALERALKYIGNGWQPQDIINDAEEAIRIAREQTVCLNAIASNEACKPDDTLKRCTICGFIVDTKYKAEFIK